MIRLGTCAWNFEDWEGVFYPDKLPSNQQLTYYSRYLPAVEIDSTFYHTPRADVAAAWAERTPDDFTFTAKMPKQITHEARLRNCERELDAFLRSLRPLGEKLGAVLIQLPPYVSPDRDEDALREFLALLPVGKMSFAVEFRNPTWHTPGIVKLLAEHGVAWAWNDLSSLEDQTEGAFEFLPETADFLYIRLMGDLETKYRPDGERKFRYGSLLWSREAALAFWAQRIRRHVDGVRDIYVMINNHFEGFSPLTCQRLGRLLDMDLPLPKPAPAAGSEQMELL